MTINDQQFEFVFNIGLLIMYAYKKGHTMSFGDAYATSGHIENSFHYKRLAIDLNLFRDGKYLTKTSDHLPLGLIWESLGGSWGGRFGDGNHYSWGEKK